MMSGEVWWVELPHICGGNVVGKHTYPGAQCYEVKTFDGRTLEILAEDAHETYGSALQELAKIVE